MLYQLTATDEQFKIIQDALEFYSRFGSGQVSQAITDLCFHNKQFASRLSNLVSPDFEEACISIKLKIFNLTSGSSHGISSYELDDSFKASYDMMQVIRHRLSWDRNPSGGKSVNFDEPMKYSRFELPKIQLLGGN